MLPVVVILFIIDLEWTGNKIKNVKVERHCGLMFSSFFVSGRSWFTFGYSSFRENEASKADIDEASDRRLESPPPHCPFKDGLDSFHRETVLMLISSLTAMLKRLRRHPISVACKDFDFALGYKTKNTYVCIYIYIHVYCVLLSFFHLECLRSLQYK